MNSIQTVKAYGLLLASCMAWPLHASSDITALYQQWIEVQVEQGEEIQAQTYQQLIGQAEQLRRSHTNIAESWALSGMIKSHHAEKTGGLEGLKSAKQARKELQKALSLDPYVFYGNTYAELGSLYFRTPSWPFSFGSEKMAEKLFYKGLDINPHGLLTNLRFGEYWFAKKDYALASQYLSAATQAISPLENSLWVNRQNEKANYLLRKIKQKSR